MTNFQTKHGFNDDEVISALQKQIRRGIEDDAFYWALEICSNGRNKSGFSRLRNRLTAITYEDIGLGDPDIVLQVSIALRDMEKMYNNNNDSWKVILSYIIMLLCRAKKSRITDHFTTYIDDVWKNRSVKEMEIEIPNYALDIHTSQGNKLGRTKDALKGITHFIKEGELLENENSDIKDIYKNEVQRIWKKDKK